MDTTVWTNQQWHGASQKWPFQESGESGARAETPNTGSSTLSSNVIEGHTFLFSETIRTFYYAFHHCLEVAMSVTRLNPHADYAIRRGTQIMSSWAKWWRSVLQRPHAKAGRSSIGSLCHFLRVLFLSQKGLFSLCDTSNPNAEFARKAMGHSPAGLFGFSHMLGGLSGKQAEYVRVPFAESVRLSFPPALETSRYCSSPVFPPVTRMRKTARWNTATPSGVGLWTSRATCHPMFLDAWRRSDDRYGSRGGTTAHGRESRLKRIQITLTARESMTVL